MFFCERAGTKRVAVVGRHDAHRTARVVFELRAELADGELQAIVVLERVVFARPPDGEDERFFRGLSAVGDERA